MRISDWSSDVCSSDLDARASACQRYRSYAVGRPGNGEPSCARGRTGSIDRGEARGIGKGLQGICDGIFPCRGARGRHLVLGYDFGTSIESDCRSEEHTSELQSLMRISYAVFCLKKKKKQ